MPIVIKEIIVRTTVEKASRELPDTEKLIRQIERRVLNRLRDEKPVQETIRSTRGKDR